MFLFFERERAREGGGREEEEKKEEKKKKKQEAQGRATGPRTANLDFTAVSVLPRMTFPGQH